MFDSSPLLGPVERDGYALVAGALSPADCRIWQHRLKHLADDNQQNGLRKHSEKLYAVRNLDELCPEIHQLWTQSALLAVLTAVLGSEFGMVRSLFFDKPPQANWAVPWHQDRTIAIRPPALLSSRFSTPRLKSGVWHCEPPADVLQRMLTLRIHLDDVTDENGPLDVVPGTHRHGKSSDLMNPVSQRIYARAGDVLLIRPLLVHASPKSAPAFSGHRRVIHLEFSPQRELPDAYQWHSFVTPAAVPI